MSDVAVGTLSSAPVSRHRGFARGEQASDVIFRGVLYAAGILVLTLLGLIIILLFHGGLPVLYAFGIDFFTSSAWNPVTEKYGAVVAVYGTIITAVIAVVVAVPAAFGISFFLTEVAPPVLRRSIGTAIQLLAAIPSIIFGMWGFFVVVPLMATYVQPALASTLGVVPVIGTLFSGAPIGTGILTAGLIMALMILPFITALFVEVLESVPPMFKEAAYGVGATTSEVFTAVSIPYGRTAIVGAVMLGLGRALGETMAVTFVIGNANRISASLFSPGASIASTIANEFPEAAPGSLKLFALLELGFLLFVLSFIVLAVARFLVRSRLET
ncbi:phosphate ABC transporter permease subunit PstC [Candidatus Raskinella chloraquaticus]|uniref:Phosphate transport system permease protein n=1 Tax=Candidatus Raskinella chloraquaticus TaxID=1951219 RepID=A0A1W9HPW8_9HYPH|nr:MAG: phosphate transporter permease subunit PstC [Proteobacteria bacterium SG_bin8]